MLPERDTYIADTWLALAAGYAPWADDDSTAPMERVVRLVQLALFVAIVAQAWAYVGFEPRVSPLGAAAVSVAAAMLAIEPAARALGHRPLNRNLTANLLARCAPAMVAALGLFALYRQDAAPLAASSGAVVGVDLAVTTNQLGWPADARRWWKGFVLSGFHLGVLGAFVAVIAFDRSRLATAAWLLVAFHLLCATALGVAWAVARVVRHQSEAVSHQIHGALTQERRSRGHWLHDEVCAELRTVSLSLQTKRADVPQAITMLNELDHSLRLKQLDQLVDSGHVRLAEVIQPYIRRVQNHGVSVDDVPSFEDAALELSPSSAEMVSRAVAVLTSNALNVGAKRLSICTHRTNAHNLTIEVTDDGPGFSLSDVPAGRGLWQLDKDLGGGAISVFPGGLGTVVAVAVNIGEDRRR